MVTSSGIGIAPPTRPRFKTIDIAKALAIVLVVIGHFTPENSINWYNSMVKVIYMFHMPLFMFASGFLYIVTYRHTSYSSFLVKKFRRLMVPYFVASVIVLMIKLAMSSILPLENPVVVGDFIAILYSPSAGYYLWFLWALFWMMVIAPWFKTVKARLILTVVSLFIWIVSDDITEIFCLRQTALHLIYFAIGMNVADYLKTRTIVPNLWKTLGLVALFSFLAAVLLNYNVDYFSGFDALGLRFVGLIAAITGVAMSFAVSELISRIKRLLPILTSLAASSFIIYLFHTTFEGFAKGILTKVNLLPTQSTALFIIAALLVIASGVIAPWWLGAKVFPRWKFTRMLFGISDK